MALFTEDRLSYGACVVFLAFSILVLIHVIIFFKRRNQILQTKFFFAHSLHWILSSTLLFFISLELIDQILNLLLEDLQVLNIPTLLCIISEFVCILSSLALYHISEKRWRVNNLLQLIFLWLFLNAFYIIKLLDVYSTPYCSQQAKHMLEFFSFLNALALLITDLLIIFMTKFNKHTAVPYLSGIEYIHTHCCFLSKISHNWANKMLFLGFKKPLQMEDLGVTPKAEDVETFYNKLKHEFKNEKKNSWNGNRNFSLWRCFWNVSKGTILFTGMLQFFTEALQFVAPFFLDIIISSLKEDETRLSSTDYNNISTPTSTVDPSNTTSEWINNSTEICSTSVKDFARNSFVLTFLMFVCYVIQTFMKKYHDFLVTKEGIRLKGALQACIFDKSLNLKMSAINDGKLMNHMTVDATQLMNFAYIAHFLWSLPLLVILGFLALFYQLGKCGAIGCVTIFFLIPVQYLLGRYLGIKQDAIMETSDKRLLKTNELLQNIKLLKMYAWENLFCEGVVKLRLKEISIMWKTSIARIIAASVTDGIPSFACILTFVLYYFLEDTPLTVNKVYSSIIIFMILANQLYFVAYVINSTIKTKISIQRLQEFLLLPQIQCKVLKEYPKEERMDGADEKKMLLSLKNEINGDGADKSGMMVQFKKFKIKKEEFVLDENNITKSRSTSDDEVVSGDEVIQITDATFSWSHNPILFDINFNLPRGKLTMLLGPVGSGKSSLLWAILGEMELIKGEQEFCKSSLAFVPQRAWIMNATIRENITFGLLYDKKSYDEVVKSVALLTDFSLFPDKDLTEIGEQGSNLSGGQKQRIGLARSLYQDADTYLLDDSLSALDPYVAGTIFNEVILKRLVAKGKTVLFVTHNTNLLKYTDNIVIMSGGRVAYHGHPDLCPSSVVDQVKTDSENDVHYPKFDHKLLKRQVSSLLPDKFNISSLSSTSLNFVTPESEEIPTIHQKENEVTKLITEEERQTGATPIYFPLQYIKHAGLHLVVIAVFLYGFKQGVRMLGDYYLGLFIENSDIGKLDNHYLMLFCFVTLASALLIPVTVFIVERLCLNASRNIHNKIIHSLSAAPMRFFDTTPIGRILNRMSADLNVIDLVLNSHLDCFLFLIMFVIGSVFINGCFNPLFIIPTIPIIVIAIVLQRFYIASCRELQRLDCTTKSHILSHFSQALSGLHIIRTSQNESKLRKESFKLINNNNLPLLFQYLINIWIGSRLDLLGAAIVLISCLSSLVAVNHGYLDTNSAGLAMLYAICNCFFLHWAMRYMSDLEIYCSNIQRLIEYCDLTREDDGEELKTHPPSDWPKSGRIEFKDVSLTYDKSLKPVVQDMDLIVPAGHKVGICGRTGSGKSTLTLGLFRLVDVCSGKILLDDRDIISVSIRDLRSRLSIIPQDPVLFSGSVRFNLDPTSIKSDDELWEALRISQLQEPISNLPNKLETQLSDGGCNMSIGERQLLCIARALLRNSQVLVMDEATASIDQKTDQVVQTIIKSAFHNKTVLTIAHRISTIMHSNRVVVMKEGRMIEEGDPKELMERKTNFASLVENS